MKERIHVFKTLVDIAKLSLKVVVPIYTLLRGTLKGLLQTSGTQ